MTDPNYPAMKWHPETGEAKTFTSADEVPKGWLDTHPNNLPANPDAGSASVPARPDPLPMSRDAIKKALDDAGITYAKSAKDQTLYDLLVSELRAHLTSQGVAWGKGDDATTLIHLLPPEPGAAE